LLLVNVFDFRVSVFLRRNRKSLFLALSLEVVGQDLASFVTLILGPGLVSLQIAIRLEIIGLTSQEIIYRVINAPANQK